MSSFHQDSPCCDLMYNFIKENGTVGALVIILGTLISCFIISISSKLSVRQFFKPSKNSKLCLNPQCYRCNLSKNSTNVVADAYYEIANTQTSEERQRLKRVSESVRALTTETADGSFVFNLKTLPSKPFFNFLESNHPIALGLMKLSDNFSVIQQEYEDSIDSIATDRWMQNNTPEGSWRILFLVNQGIQIPENIQMFKKTFDILQNNIQLISDCVFGNIAISVISPQTVISPHKGPTNCRLRCHLGIKIPEGTNCFLEVNKKTNYWTKGKSVVFDDSFEHSVINRSYEERVILMFDIWHPELTSLEIKILNRMFSSSSILQLN